jgi:hypothetical protein
MDLSKYKDQLGEGGFEELTKYVQTLISQKEEARQESINGRKSLKDQVIKLTAIKDTLFDKLGVSDEDDINSIQIPTKDSAVEVSKQYEKRIKKLEADLKVSQESYTGLEGKYRGSLTEAALRKALSAHDFVDQDLVADFVKQRVKFEEDQLYYVDGDTSLSIDEGVKLLATSKPHLLKAQGTGGSGFNANTNSGKTKSFKEMNLPERNALYKENKELYKQLQFSA